jgi:dihydrofolate synthase/folylpolyglutamate synthase
MEALVGLLGDPQRAFRGIHLTGTNGKTSTARMIDELLRGFGLRTGRYTSPHLSSVTERIVVDGLPVSDRTFVEAYRELAPYIELIDGQFDVPLSFFEIMTGLAYAIFADTPVDVAVVEVGMGGAWDNTNVLDAEIAVVTPIDLDHTQYLGTTVDAIAREGLEFGILDRRVAVGGQVVTLQGLGGVYDEVFLPLHGAHQAQNAALALAAVEAFLGIDADSGSLDAEIVRAAFAAVRSPGRLEPVRSAPTILLDSAHNPHGVSASVAAIDEAFDFRRLIAVVAVLADKDVTGMLERLEPVVDELVVTQNGSDRAVPVDELATVAVDIFGTDRVSVEPRLDDALETAVRLAEDTGDDVLSGTGVLVIGSVVTVGEARLLLGSGAT